MTNRIDDDTALTHAVRFYRLSLLTEDGDPDNAVIVSWQNKAASPNAAHAALNGGCIGGRYRHVRPAHRGLAGEPGPLVPRLG